MKEKDKIFPLKNVPYEKKDKIVILIQKKERLNFIEKLFFKKIYEKPYYIDLDEIGSYVWELCNGKRSISEIIEEARMHFGQLIYPAEQRIELFIKQLAKNKFVKLLKKIG